jgi:hypothetical protein
VRRKRAMGGLLGRDVVKRVLSALLGSMREGTTSAMEDVATFCLHCFILADPVALRL